jgi:hypothetical protein
MIAGEQPGLRRLVQKRLLDDVFEAASGKSQSQQEHQEQDQQDEDQRAA